MPLSHHPYLHDKEFIKPGIKLDAEAGRTSYGLLRTFSDTRTFEGYCRTDRITAHAVRMSRWEHLDSPDLTELLHGR